MRKCSLILPMLVLAIGCTSGQLRFSTVRQANTLTDLQHQLVLNNLAAFACNPDAIPSQVNLTTGSTQVTDTGSPGGTLVTGWAATLAGSRSIVDQWETTPVTDDTTLKLLQVAYRRALGSAEDLYTNDLANDLAHSLVRQTGPVDDLRTLNQLISPVSVNESLGEHLSRSIRTWSGDGGRPTPAIHPPTHTEMQSGREYFGICKDHAKKYNESMQAIISSISERIVLKGEILTEDNLVMTPVKDLVTGATVQAMCKKLDKEGKETKVEEKQDLFAIATPLAADVRRQVMETNESLSGIHSGWLGVGGKKDVPKCACYVGCHKECGCDCYVWVLPEGRKAFEDFTITILGLASLIQPVQVTINPGVKYSPGAVGGAAGTMARSFLPGLSR